MKTLYRLCQKKMNAAQLHKQGLRCLTVSRSKHLCYQLVSLSQLEARVSITIKQEPSFQSHPLNGAGMNNYFQSNYISHHCWLWRPSDCDHSMQQNSLMKSPNTLWSWQIESPLIINILPHVLFPVRTTESDNILCSSVGALPDLLVSLHWAHRCSECMQSLRCI